MALTPFDINKELKKNVNKLVDNSGIQGMCIPISATYTQLTMILNALVLPAAAMKSSILGVLDSNKVLDALGEINKTLDVLNSGLGKSNFIIDPKALAAINIFSKICVDFNDILPKSLKKKMDKFIENTIEDGLDYLSDAVDDFGMPDDIIDAIQDGESFFKENALSDALSDATKTILSPLTVYRKFIKSSGILPILRKLQKFERCMTNPKTCNRPKKEFYFPNTKKYNSQYYMELLSINLKGEVQLSRMNSSVKSLERKMSKSLNKLDNFINP